MDVVAGFSTFSGGNSLSSFEFQTKKLLNNRRWRNGGSEIETNTSK